MDRIDDLAETIDGLLNSFLIGEVDVVVTLHADTVDGHTSVLHLLYHLIDTLALALVHAAVVVVDQHTCGISLAGKFECLGDELVATELEVLALTIGAGSRSTWAEPTEHHVVVGHSFVDHIPSIDHILIAVYHRVDMFAQTLVEHFLLDGLTLLVGEHPVGKLRVPAETVTTHLDAVLATEVGDAVG